MDEPRFHRDDEARVATVELPADWTCKVTTHHDGHELVPRVLRDGRGVLVGYAARCGKLAGDDAQEE